MKLKKNLLKAVAYASLCLSAVGCASLLMLPDEVTEEQYRTRAGDITPQLKTKSNVTNQFVKINAVPSKKVGILPIYYIYDTTNTLKNNEEAYYTSIFNNSSGSWIRPFAILANNAIRDELKARGFEPFLYANSDLKALGMKQAGDSAVMGKLFGTSYKAIAYNGDSSETNYVETDETKFRNAIVNDVAAVAYMKIHADWEPTTANTLNGDVVLNTDLKFGYDIVLCGANSGCVSISTPFEKGITASVFMPNRNTINEEGRDKNYEILKSIHGDQLKKVVKNAFAKLEAYGAFK